jgi:hypothetical protein
LSRESSHISSGAGEAKINGKENAYFCMGNGLKSRANPLTWITGKLQKQSFQNCVYYLYLAFNAVLRNQYSSG